MKQAESIIKEKIVQAFSGVKPVSRDYGYDSWRDIPYSLMEVSDNLFAYYSHEDELFLLPVFLCYLLHTFRDSPQSTIYMYISGTLREYSKSKCDGCFKYSISNEQFYAVEAFIKHFPPIFNSRIVNV